MAATAAAFNVLKVENYAATAAAVIRYTSIEVALKIDQKAF